MYAESQLCERPRARACVCVCERGERGTMCMYVMAVGKGSWRMDRIGSLCAARRKPSLRGRANQSVAATLFPFAELRLGDWIGDQSA